MAGMTAEQAFEAFQNGAPYFNHPGHFASEAEWSRYKHMIPQGVKKAFKEKVAGNEARFAEGQAQGLTPEQMGVFDKKEHGQALLRRMAMGNLDKSYDYDWASGFKTNVGTSDLAKRGIERIPITQAERAHKRELDEARAGGTNIFRQHRQDQIRDLLASGAIESDGAGGFRNPGPGGGESYGANLEGYNLGQNVFGGGRGTGGASVSGGGYTPGTISGPVREGDSGFTGGTRPAEPPRTGGGFQTPPGVVATTGARAPQVAGLPANPPAPAAPQMTTGQKSQPEPIRAPGTPGPKPGTPALGAPPPGVNTGAPGRPSTAPLPSPAAPVRPPSSPAPAPVAPPLPARPAAGGLAPAARPVAPAVPAAAQMSRVPSPDEFAQLGPGATAQTPWGQVVPKEDGRPQLVLDEAGKAAFVQARAKAIGDFGPLPSWAQGPGMPPPPVEPGRWNVNPWTGMWSGGPGPDGGAA